MPTLNRDLFIVFRILASCLTAGLLIFFFSAFAGEDLLKNHSTIKDLDRILGEIKAPLVVVLVALQVLMLTGIVLVLASLAVALTDVGYFVNLFLLFLMFRFPCKKS